MCKEASLVARRKLCGWLKMQDMSCILYRFAKSLASHGECEGQAFRAASFATVLSLPRCRRDKVGSTGYPSKQDGRPRKFECFGLQHSVINCICLAILLHLQICNFAEALTQGIPIAEMKDGAQTFKSVCKPADMNIARFGIYSTCIPLNGQFGALSLIQRLGSHLLCHTL